jgi:chromosome partitioning protein
LRHFSCHAPACHAPASLAAIKHKGGNMIITIFNEDQSAKRSILAINLVALGALNHRKAALIDATSPQYSLNWSVRRNAVGVKLKIAVHAAESLHSEMENQISTYRTQYREIVIDTDGVDSLHCESALVATNVLVVPAWSSQGDLRGHENVIQRIETARLFNPALRVLVVDVRTISAFSDAGKRESEAAAAFAKKVLGATLASTVIHERIDDRRAFDGGLSILECDPCNEPAAAEIKDLYQEIAGMKDLPMQTANGIAVTNAIQRILHGKAGI